jgi:hypothetical protein
MISINLTNQNKINKRKFLTILKSIKNIPIKLIIKLIKINKFKIINFNNRIIN